MCSSVLVHHNSVTGSGRALLTPALPSLVCGRPFCAQISESCMSSFQNSPSWQLIQTALLHTCNPSLRQRIVRSWLWKVKAIASLTREKHITAVLLVIILQFSEGHIFELVIKILLIVFFLVGFKKIVDKFSKNPFWPWIDKITLNFSLSCL